MWYYFTDISPFINNSNSFDEAFYKFLSDCKIDENIIKKQRESNNNKYFRFLIKTDEKNNKIECSDGKFFLKSKFLTNKNFKKSLINYYKPLNIYITGPREIIKGDGSGSGKWIIDLIFTNTNQCV